MNKKTIRDFILLFCVALVIYSITLKITYAQNYSVEVPARDLFYYCYNNNTLKGNSSEEICIDDVCNEITREYSLTCAYGCDNSTFDCAPSPTNRYFIMGGVFIGFLVLLLFLLKVKR